MNFLRKMHKFEKLITEATSLRLLCLTATNHYMTVAFNLELGNTPLV